MPRKINNYLKAFLALSLAIFFLSGAVTFEKKDVLAAESDAVAVRVLPNPHHYSPLAWYQDQKFSGNPTPLIVDGYEAIQDGRTVYVNVANVSESGVYTNIYLISYNQSAAPETISIFNKVLSKWKFNTNLTETGFCFNQKDTSQVCLADSECTGSGFCSSLKAKITRDTKRLADIVGLKLQLEKYSKSRGHFPLLSAGTYVTGKTISTWPSWTGEFASELGSAQPIDPINKLGDCGGAQYDPVTCWDETTKSFPTFNTPDGLPPNSRIYMYSTDAKGTGYGLCAETESGLSIGQDQDDWQCLGSYLETPTSNINCGSLIGVTGQDFTGYITVTGAENGPALISISDLPAAFKLITDSNAPVYSSNDQCQSYFSKIVKEVVRIRKGAGKTLREITGMNWSAGPCYPILFPPGNAAQCEANRQLDMSTFGFTTADFGGASFVFDENEGERGQDPKDYCVLDAVVLNNCPGNIECGNASINCGTIGIPFYSSKCNGVGAADTIISKATIVSSDAAAGSYPITVKVSNGQGVETVKKCTINISSNANIIYPIADQKIAVGKTLNFTVFAFSSKKDYTGLSINFQNVPADFSCGPITVMPDGRAKCTVSYKTFFTADNGPVTVTASNNAGDSFTSQQFGLNIYNNPPKMQPIKCLNSIRVGADYSCQISATDPDGHRFSFQASSMPPGLSLSSDDGVISGKAAAGGVYDIVFTATDEYGATSPGVNFTLKIDSYCGDSIKESPNTEGKGGVKNNGYEDCDCGGYKNYLACAAGANTGVPANPASSTVTWQYGCNSGCASMIDGFCGDQVSQDGEYNLFKSTLGKEKAAGLEMSHSRIDYGEQCDDGNNINGDGCNTYDASGNPLCQWTCGDGVINDGRYLSFANGVETDSYNLWGDISSYHSRDIALNSASQPEQCDDGNTIDGDGCNTFSSNCLHVCGDGHLDSGEQCEVERRDANTAENLNGLRCQDVGGVLPGRNWDGGSLHCNGSSCLFNTDQCVYYDDVSGHIGQALNGSDASGVTVSVVYNGQTYSAVSGDDGKFTIKDVPHRAPTEYTINSAAGGTCASADRGSPHDVACLSTSENFSMSGPITGLELYVFPDDWAGLYAFVLTWNGPTDLDSHLTFGSNHIFYQARGPSNGSSLDWDDLTNNGHEVLSVNALQPGIVYNYYVNNYGHEHGSGADFNSTMNVKIFSRISNQTVLLTNFPVMGQDRSDNYWQVFSFTAGANTIEPVRIVDSYGNGSTMSISGIVKDATSDEPLAGAVATIVYNNKDAETYSATSDASGNFSISNIPNYLIGAETRVMTIVKDGYLSNSEDVNMSGTGPSKPYYLFPNTWNGLFAIVLNWNNPPADLDAYMKFSSCTIYYGTAGVRCLGNELDRDDLNQSIPPDNNLSRGEEMISLYSLDFQPGIENNLRKYYIHNYSGGNFNNSARVRFFRRDNNQTSLIQECVAENRPERYWSVFNFYTVLGLPSDDYFQLVGLSCKNTYSDIAP